MRAQRLALGEPEEADAEPQIRIPFTAPSPNDPVKSGCQKNRHSQTGTCPTGLTAPLTIRLKHFFNTPGSPDVLLIENCWCVVK